jgi:hypothetical protein
LKAENESAVEPKAGGERRDWPWKKAKKVAVMISFCGKDYLGMQRFLLLTFYICLKSFS